jgi:hypothetical protein
MNRDQLEHIATVARAYATVDRELPSTNPGIKNPKTIYVLKEGKPAASGVQANYDTYPFEVFRPYIKEARRDAHGIYYELCDEFVTLVQKT